MNYLQTNLLLNLLKVFLTYAILHIDYHLISLYLKMNCFLSPINDLSQISSSMRKQT